MSSRHCGSDRCSQNPLAERAGGQPGGQLGRSVRLVKNRIDLDQIQVPQQSTVGNPLHRGVSPAIADATANRRANAGRLRLGEKFRVPAGQPGLWITDLGPRRVDIAGIERGDPRRAELCIETGIPNADGPIVTPRLFTP